MPKTFKRNSVVIIPNSSGGFAFYGRIHKLIGPDHAIVVDCGSHYGLYHNSVIKHTPEYTGYYLTHPIGAKHFLNMSTLRRLLKRCRRYYPDLNPFIDDSCKLSAAELAEYGIIEEEWDDQ